MATPILPTGYVKSVTIGSANNPGRLTVIGGALEVLSAVTGNRFTYDPATGAMHIGDDTYYLDWNGSSLSLRGLLNADDIVAGTITGRTLQTILPAAGTGSSVKIIGGSDEMIYLYYDDTQTGTIKGYTTEGSEVTHIGIEAASGRNIKLKDSKLTCNGDFKPHSDRGESLGGSGERWDYVWAKYTAFGDLLFTDKACPFCEKEFEEGDIIVYYIHKKELKEDVIIHYSIPIHLDCASKYKDKSVTIIKKFIMDKETEYESIMKAKADEILRVEEEMAKKIEEEKKKKIEERIIIINKL
jgi:hypothetical protein